MAFRDSLREMWGGGVEEGGLGEKIILYPLFSGLKSRPNSDILYYLSELTPQKSSFLFRR